MSTKIITKPKVHIDPSLLEKINSKVHEMGQVVIHFLFSVPANMEDGTLIRIWPTTYLYDKHSTHESELVFAENITMFPQWQHVPAGGKSYFTLIFSGLPKSCIVFDMIEKCSGGGAFKVLNIPRNESDVYFVNWI